MSNPPDGKLRYRLLTGPDDDKFCKRVSEALGVDRAHVHIYGKDSLPGRKLGHVTALADTVEEAHRIASDAVGILEGGA